MKINKRLLPIFAIVLIFLAAFIAGSFSHRDQSDAREVIRSELDRLKDLDSKTTQKYISYKEMFPDATENTELSDEINNVFSLFFQKFDYKILDISVDKKSNTAEASLKLTTIDAQSLARDFATELLKTQITETAQAKSGTVKDSSKSLEGHYLILNRLLTTNTYDSTENNCTIQLINNGSGQKENWEIRRTYSLENDLVGGLMVYLSDPDILSPEDTLSVYFNTLKKMNLEEMSSYLGVLNIMNTSDSVKNSIAEALVEQVHQNFNFKIQSSSVNGYNATVTTAITTFDSNAILSNYQSSLDTFLNQMKTGNAEFLSSHDISDEDIEFYYMSQYLTETCFDKIRSEQEEDVLAEEAKKYYDEHEAEFRGETFDESLEEIYYLLYSEMYDQKLKEIKDDMTIEK